MEAAKRGRKPKPHITAGNETINGLRRRPVDGKWQLADGRVFTEPDERKAIERFRRMVSPFAFDGAVGLGTPIQITHEQLAQLAADQETEPADLLEIFLDAEPGFWRRVAEEIFSRPKWVAEQTGIEWIAYGPQLKSPQPLPTFADIENNWRQHFKKSKEQKRRVLRAWADFKETAKVAGLRDIDSQKVTAYKHQVYSKNLTPKAQANLFTRIRRILSFAADEAVGGDDGIKAIRACLMILALLKPSDGAVSLKPKPIRVGDFDALLKHASGDNRAMILLMLNGGFYCAEVIRLKWSEINDGCIVTRRRKEGNCVRACVLWPETVAALAQLERQGEYVFYNYAGKPLGVKGAEKRFRALRKKAEVPHVVSSQLRDGTASAIARGLANSDVRDKAQLEAVVLGHRSGIRDHYVERDPAMVKPACDAVRQFYLG